MRRSRGPFVGMVVALTCSVAGVMVTTAPADAVVSGVTGSSLSAAEGVALTNVVVATYTGTPGDSYTVTINWGDSTTSSGAVSNTGNAFTVKGSHTYADEGTFTTTISVNDTTDASTGSGTGSASISENDTLAAGAPMTITPTEGSAFSGNVATFTDTNASATAADFTASINWGDTTTSAGTVSGSTGGPFTVSGNHTYADDGPYSMTVTLTDDAPGTATATAHPTANVGEAGLTLVTPNLSATEGQVFSGTVATLTDPGTNDPASDFTVSIDWGDGVTNTGVTPTGPAGGPYTVSGTHTYADEGSFTVVIRAQEIDAANQTAVQPFTMTVAETDALTGHPATFSATQFTPFTATVATFTDTNTGNVPADFTATINWGDASTSDGTVTEPSPGNYSVSGSHTYATTGAKTVTVTLTDDAPGTASATAVSTANVTSPCTTTIQNSRVRKPALGTGTTCFIHDVISGTITVPAGDSVFISSSTVSGRLTAVNPAAVSVCGSRFSGAVNISGATKFVLLGDPGDDFCAGNTLRRGVTLTSNHGGLEVGHNHVSGSVTVTGTTGHGPAAEDVGTEIEANLIGGSLNCSGNTPVATNDTQPNTVAGAETGECAPPF